MKKSTKGKAALSACQIQAIRLNKLEYRRLQRNVNLMHDDLKTHLLHLQRQAQRIQYHYTNVVRVVKPNPTYQLWKQAHAYEIEQDNIQNSLESMKLKRNLKCKTNQQVPSPNEVSSEPKGGKADPGGSTRIHENPSGSTRIHQDPRGSTRIHQDPSGSKDPGSTFSSLSEPTPRLLVLVDNDIKKRVENFLQSNNSSTKKHSSDQNRLTMLNEHSINRSQQSTYSTGSFLPPIVQPSSRKFEQTKFIPTITQKTSNLDALYGMAFQNQTGDKSLEQTHIEKRKLFDKEFATQHRTLKGTIRLPSLVK